MKLKGVNPIAQHIEKIVLGLTTIIFLAVISLQFVSQPNKVDTGTRKVAPDQIYNELASSANALQSQISDLSPALPDVKPVDLLATYNNAFDANENALTQLPIALGKGTDVVSLLSITDFTPQGGENLGDIQAMSVPATTTPLASSTWATLDPYAILEVPDYADFVPTAQPFDFPSVSIEADFPGTTLRDVLQGNDGHPGVPRLFWATTGMAIMALDVQRQQRLPDGSWSEPTPITTPPATPLPTNAVTKHDGLVRLNTIIASAQEVAPQIMRPTFPPTISGPTWEPPSNAISDKDLGLTQTQRLQRTLTRLTAEVQRLQNPTRSRTRSTQDRSGKTSRNTRDPGSGGGGGGGQSTNPRTQERIERLEKQIDSIQQELEELGIDTDDTLVTPKIDILNQDILQLWAHDLGVTPGATYRYRTRAVLNNPYFRKGPYLDETDHAQQELTIEPFIAGSWSDWSKPVVVGDKEFFFVAEATQPISGADLPQAKVELYSMYYGYYRRSSMNIEPGQPLQANIRISGNLVLFDTDTLDAQAAANYIQNPDNQGSDLPEGITPAPSRLTINLGAYLLQVTNDPIPSDLSPKAANARIIFRLPDGSIEYRNSASDRSSTIYAQAQSSATKASRAQLRPTGQPAIPEATNLFKKVEP